MKRSSPPTERRRPDVPVNCKAEAERIGASLHVRDFQGFQRRLFEITGLEQVFHLTEDTPIQPLAARWSWAGRTGDRGWLTASSSDGTVLGMADDAERAVRRFLDAYNAHDLDAVAAVFTSDAVYDDKGTGSRHEGKEAVVAYVQAAFTSVPDCSWTLRSIIAAGDRAALEGTFAGTLTLPDGASGAASEQHPINLDAATIFDVRDGLISSLVDYHSYSSAS
jgi:steroid delta-isomerase-like uncharacterized protein